MSEQLSLGFGVTKNADSWFETGGKDSRRGRRPSDFPWTAEQVEQLRKLTDDGLSCSQIAAQLGTSRNSVIGKQHRVGIRSKGPSTQAIGRSRPKKPKALPIYPGRFRKQYTRKPPMDFDNYQSPIVEVVPLNLTFAQLQPGQCKYPYGDENFLFCGLPLAGESPYCAQHHHVCHHNRPWGNERPDVKYRNIKRRQITPVALVSTTLDPIDPDERGEAA